MSNTAHAMTEPTMLQPEALSAAIHDLGEKVIARVRTVFDPEIPVNIYDLGLIYKIDINPADNGKYMIHIAMTLTTPNCPVAGQMPAMVQNAVINIEEAEDVKVELVWDPPWDKSRMTDEARLALNMF
jgi:hypothetical protein